MIFQWNPDNGQVVSYFSKNPLISTFWLVKLTILPSFKAGLLYAVCCMMYVVLYMLYVVCCMVFGWVPYLWMCINHKKECDCLIPYLQVFDTFYIFSVNLIGINSGKYSDYLYGNMKVNILLVQYYMDDIGGGLVWRILLWESDFSACPI